MKIYKYIDWTSNCHWFKTFRNALKCVEIDIANKFGLKESEYVVEFNYLENAHMYSVCLCSPTFQPGSHIDVIETED